MKKINIMLVIPNLNRGGAEKVMSIIANNLDREKFNVTILLLQKKGHYLNSLEKDIRVLSVNQNSVKKSLFPLVKIINKEKPDIVFSTLGHLNLTLMLLKPFLNKKIKFVAREASIPSIMNKKEKFPFLFNLLYKLLYNKFDKVICQSEYMKKDLISNFSIKKNKLIVINNPLEFNKIENLSNYEYEKSFISKSFLNAPKKVLAVGSLEPIKQFDKLIIHFSRIKNEDIKLFIIGEGSQESNLMQLIKDLKLENKVYLLGFQKNPYKYMKLADLMVLTSQFEGFPNVVLESMACGTPVLAFKCPGGIEEIIIEGKNGWFVEHNNFERLINLIPECINNELDEKVIKKTIYQRYDLRYIMKKYNNLFIRIRK